MGGECITVNSYELLKKENKWNYWLSTDKNVRRVPLTYQKCDVLNSYS